MSSFLLLYTDSAVTRILHESDFSAGTGGWSGAGGSIVAGNVDAVSDGTISKDDCLSLTIDGVGSGSHYCKLTLPWELVTVYTIQFDYYIPATNSNCEGMKTFAIAFDPALDLSSTGSTPATIGDWTHYSLEAVTTNAAQFRLYQMDGNTNVFADAGGDDVIYFKNFLFTWVE